MQERPAPDADRSGDDTGIRTLYQDLLMAWNERNAAAYAACFEPNAHVVGFDGSQMRGSSEIETTLTQIFAHHVTASYVAKVREVSVLAPGVVLLRAIVGMVLPGKVELDPTVIAVQSLVARRDAGTWRIALFQNTPAAFHGRPELVEQMTDELSSAAKPVGDAVRDGMLPFNPPKIRPFAHARRCSNG